MVVAIGLPTSCWAWQIPSLPVSRSRLFYRSRLRAGTTVATDLSSVCLSSNKENVEPSPQPDSRTISKQPNQKMIQTPFSRADLENQVQTLRAIASNSTDEAHPNTTLTPHQCDAVLASCVAADAWDLVLEILEDVMQQRDWIQTHATYTASLQACANVSNAAAAYEIWIAMQAAQVLPDATDVGYLLKALCEQARYEDEWYKTALETLDQVGPELVASVPMDVLEAVLREMSYRHAWKRALRLLQTVLDRRVEVTEDTFRWTVTACVKAGQPEPAAQILSSSLTLLPNATASVWQPLFSSIITGLSKKGQWRKGLQILDLIEKQSSSDFSSSTCNLDTSLYPTLAMYNAIMGALAKAKELSQAKRLMRRLKDRDELRPDILTYNSLMTAASRRWKEALQVLDQCHRQPGVEPDVYTYTNAIRACAKGGKISRALTLFEVVKDKELPMDAYVYTATMEACAKGKLWDRAMELLQEMQDEGIPPTEVTYSVAITACGNAGKWEKALQLLGTMRSKGLLPNLITYNGAISAMAKAAKQATRDASPSAVSPNHWHHVQTLLDQMRTDNLEPDGFTYSSAISCCGSEGRWEEALSLIEKMRQGGPATRPNKIAYTAAISSCGRNGQDEHALRLFLEMKRDGLSPDRVSFNALFSALRVAKRSDVALELWDEMLGGQPTGSTLKRPQKVATARKDDEATSPDIITVTDAIGALSADDSTLGRANVDRVFQQAVERGIVMRSNRLDSLWEVDLSGMSLPVARAAARYLLGQIALLVKCEDDIQDLVLITGVGVGKESSSTLRSYIQEILQKDFDPPLDSSIPQRAQGTVVVDSTSVESWLSRQERPTLRS